MRVLSQQEFVKKVSKAVLREDGYKPVLTIRPNWQIALMIEQDDGELGMWLGPNPAETGEDAYIVFLSEVDILARTTMATSFVQDRMPREGGQ